MFTPKWIFYLIWTNLLQCVCWRQSPGTLSAPAYDRIWNRASILILIIPIDKVVGGHRKGEAKETQGEEIHFIVCSCRLSTIFWLRIGLSTLRLYDCMISIDSVFIFTHDCGPEESPWRPGGVHMCPHSPPSNWSSATRALINIYRYSLNMPLSTRVVSCLGVGKYLTW